VNVGEICNRDPTTVCASATLNEAAELLSNSYADALVAIASPVQRPTAVGMITYLDLLSALQMGGNLERMHVLDVLDKNPLVLNEDEDIDRAILKLGSRGAKHAPVVGSGGTLWGAISMERLLGCRCAGQLRSHSARVSCGDYL
jgi:predicted transcriptional regulator